MAGHTGLFGLALWLLLPFVSIALYTSPITDDFCLSSHSFAITAAAVWRYYDHVGGRVFALLLSTVPSDLANLTGLDLYVVYPLVDAVGIIAFIAAIVLSMVLLFSKADRKIAILFGLLFSIFILATVPDLQEFIYWVTGEACYLSAAAATCLFIAWSTPAALSGEAIDSQTKIAVLIGCFLVTTANEFTPILLIGVTLLTAAIRHQFSAKDAQIGFFATILGVILIAYSIMLLAPGNAERVAAHPQSRNFAASIHNASTYTLEYWNYLKHLPHVRAFLVIILCFAVAANDRSYKPLPAIFFAIALLAGVALWVFVSYFIGAFGTGEVIALRARNELLAVFAMSTTISIFILIRGVVVDRLAFLGRHRLWIIAIGALFILPVRSTKNYQTIHNQWPELATFWQESVARDLYLDQSRKLTEMVPDRSVTPSLLMGEELKKIPFTLPNDCVAVYYGKDAVVLAPVH